MTDKYQSEWVGDFTVKIAIPDGAAKGEYTKFIPEIVDGLIFLATISLPSGKIAQVKIRAEEHPALVAECERRRELFAEAARREAESPESQAALALERKMAAEGFEAAGNAGDLFNRLMKFDGSKF